MKKIFSPSPLYLESGMALCRVITGIFLVYHGWEVFDGAAMREYASWDQFKTNANPSIMPYVGKASELLAGILLILGLFTRIASIITIGTLGYIAFSLGHGKVWSDDQYPFLFVLLGLIFFFYGGGKYSLDHVLFKPRIS